MWKKLTAILIGLLLGFAACEIVLRLTGLAPEAAVISVGRFRLSANPELVYEPIPNFEFEGEVRYFYEFRGISNGLGFRDRDHDVTKPPGVYRILVLGDSIAMGLRTDDTDDIFPSALERSLRATGRNVEVLNFGVSGYNTQQEVAMLADRGLAFDPDLVVLQYCLNDRAHVDGGITQTLRRQESRSGIVDRALTSPHLYRSAIYRFVRFRVFTASYERRHAERLRTAQALGQDTVSESFKRLRRIADDHDFDVLVVVFPMFKNFPPQAERSEHRRIEALSRAQGFHHLDLVPTFETCRGAAAEPAWLDVYHPSARGHGCVGEAIASYVTTQRIAGP